MTSLPSQATVWDSVPLPLNWAFVIGVDLLVAFWQGEMPVKNQYHECLFCFIVVGLRCSRSSIAWTGAKLIKSGGLERGSEWLAAGTRETFQNTLLFTYFLQGCSGLCFLIFVYKNYKLCFCIFLYITNDLGHCSQNLYESIITHVGTKILTNESLELLTRHHQL